MSAELSVSVAVHQRTRTRTLIWLCATVALGFLLRVWHIGSKGLWIDEAFSVWVGWQPVARGLDWLVRIDQHPPLYYLTLRLWMRMGDDPVTVRLLSASLSTVNIPVLYRLGQRLAGHSVGLLAAVILALSPFHVRFAQEARMYALLCLNASAAIWALACLLLDERSSSERIGRQLWAACCSWRATGHWPRLDAIRIDLAWAAYVFFTVAMLWTHNTGVLFVAAANGAALGLAWARGRQRLCVRLAPNWAIAHAGILLLWSPWIRPFFVQSRAVYGEFWLPAPTWNTVVHAVRDLLVAYLPDRLEWAWVIWAGYGALLALGAWSLRPVRGHLWALLALVFIPVGGEWAVSLARPIFYDRTLIWASIPLYVLLALGVQQLRYRSYILSAMAMLVTVSLLSVREYDLRFQKEGWDKGAAYVAARAEQGDLILLHASWVQIPFDYYLRTHALPPGVSERGVPVDLFERGVLEPKMTVEDLPGLHRLVRNHRRVWLVYSHQWYTDPNRLVVAALEESMMLHSRRRFHGLEVRLYLSREERQTR